MKTIPNCYGYTRQQFRLDTPYKGLIRRQPDMLWERLLYQA
jgi:hypothetical protein